jgi:polyphosphate:AMP phosphotransferase
MFKTAELGQKVSKQEYRQLEPVLRQELLQSQFQLKDAPDFPVIIVFAGVDGAGKGATVNLLNEWMDPRWLITNAYKKPSEEERERPPYWRYWRDMPPKGQIGLFLSSWYSGPVLDRVYKKLDDAQFSSRLERIVKFENSLTNDGALILKFWMHMSKAAQKSRLRALEKDPLTNWQVTERDWDHWRLYSCFIEVAEQTIMQTSVGGASWTIVEGVDAAHRSLTVGTIIRDAIVNRLEETRLAKELQSKLAEEKAASDKQRDASDDIPALSITRTTVLGMLEMSKTIDKRKYRTELKKLQGKLNLLHRQALDKKLSTLMLMEGMDAAGKGGAIRRMTAAMEARNYKVYPFAAPTDEERAQHYLWRFWRHLSRAGRVIIFDRSWYGRVLVERVEGFAGENEWQRAYAEINDFEQQITDHGIILLKYWLHISEDEQLARFKARQETPYKRWKLTDEDWRNREKWDDYEMAAHDMVQRTSTLSAPWHLIEGNDKRYARIKILRIACDAIEAALAKRKKNK